MESRRIYRAVEDAARFGVPAERFPHSPVSDGLRYDVRESSDLRSMIAARMIASSALKSHAGFDPGEAFKSYKDALSLLFDTIPYMSDRKGSDGKSGDREAAVELFERVSERMSALAERMSSSMGGGKVDIESE